jgi:hypothetical protein
MESSSAAANELQVRNHLHEYAHFLAGVKTLRRRHLENTCNSMSRS